MKHIERRKRVDEEGFTLIELLVVVLILGILMAIAIPTFLSLTGGAKTTAAEADLTTAAQDEAVYLTENGSFDATPGADASQWSNDNIAAMQQADSGINWAPSAGTTAGTKTVGVEVDTTNAVKEKCDGDLDRLCEYPIAAAASLQAKAQALSITAEPVIGKAASTQVLYLETAGADGNYYWIEDIGGTLTYAETTSMLDPGTYPDASDWVTAWNQLSQASAS